MEEEHLKGATEEEMESILNGDVEILEKDLQAVPRWLYFISFVNVLLSVVFCIWSLVQIF